MEPVDLFPLLRPLLKSEDFQAMMLEFVSGLAFAFQCDRVSIGFVDKNTIHIAAISGFSEVPSAAMLPELQAAMQESILQDVAIVFPQSSTDFPHIVLAHAKLAQMSTLTRALTVPFGHDAKIVGAITFERQRVIEENPNQLSTLSNLAQQASPLLELKWRLSLPPAKRLRLWGQRQLSRLDERSTRWRYGAIGAAVLLALGVIVVPVTNQVAGEARLEAYTQRIITAPIDGFLKTVRVRPGDIVKAKQSLAELSDDTLRTESRRLVAEASQEENSVAEAMAKYDRAQVVVHRSKLDSLLAQKDLIEERLGRIQMIAPFDGVVIKGDLTQMMGSPVKRGDVLLTLAEGTGFRVMIDVPERDIGDIEVGQTGNLMLTALPDQKFRIHIVRIMPVANVSAENQNGFEVEAVLDEAAPALVPGLKGAAKIATGQKAFGWKWLVRGWQRLYFLVWSRGG